MATTAVLPNSPSRPPPIHTPSYPYHPPASPTPSLSPLPAASPPSRFSHSRSNTSNSASSTTPSSILNFPSPNKPSPNTPNAHPYAIKTTSTALLSRSSSSAAQAANAVHRYVPPASPSASPISPSSGANGTDDGELSADSQKSNGSNSMGMGRKGRHRYSRSLTDGPLPVPIPPGVTNNANSPYTGYSPSPSPSYRVRERARSLVSEPDEEETPRRRPDGTLTSSSASSMGPPATPLHRYSSSDGTRAQFSLPEDPKSWSEAQVSGYLASMLRGGGEKGENDVTNTVAAYVRAKGIGGKAFLRLSENDLERLDPSLPPLARETLLRASRALRQNSLRDRMFSSNSPFSGTGNLDFNSRHSLSNDDHTGDEAELNAEGVTLRRRTARMVRPRTRSRNSSLSSDSSVSSSASASGRVREMVDELERSSSLVVSAMGGQHGKEMEEEGTASSSRSSSPTKSSFLHTSRHVEASPNKGRALPVRPTVNDLFTGPRTHHTGSSSASTMPGVLSEREVEAKETDETITRVAKKNVNGREPRLLPFPPTTPGNMGMGVPGGVLSPVHTGSGYPLPLSPEQLYLQQQYPGDYELGFRHAASPHAQTFVVRHGPSPSNLQNAKHSPNASSNGSGSGNTHGKPTRLLPYPPVTSETALHHPRPRRAIGVSDRDASGAEASPPATETEGDVDAAYVTALESQVSSNAASELSSDASSVLGGVDEEGEELSVAELLAHHGTHGVSGAEAWEIELGDTVKRIGEAHAQGAQPDSSKKTRASHKEIGRKAGRGGTGEKLQGAGVGTGRDNNKASLRRPGIIGLFDVQAEPEEGGVGNILTAPIDEEVIDLTAVNAQESKVEELDKDKEVERREANEKRVEERIREVDELAKVVDEKRREIEAQAGKIDARSKDVDERAKAVDEMREEVDVRSREVGERAKDIEERMKNLDENRIALDIREHSLVSREEAISRRERAVDDEVEEKTQSREADLNLKAQRVDETEAVIQAREAALEQRTRDVALREEAVWTKEETLDEREKMLRQAEQNLRMAKDQLSERETGLEIAERELTARELRFQAREISSGKEKDAPTEAKAIVTAQLNGEHAAAEEQTIRFQDRESNLGTDILRRCWGTFVLPVVGEERTPAFLRMSVVHSTPAAETNAEVKTKSTPDLPKPNRYRTPTWAIRRDAFLGRFMGGPGGLTDGYLVLMGIGMCVIVLRVLGRRGWAMRR